MPVRFVHKKRSKITYSDKPMFLDIETSHNHDPENPICWIVSIQVLFDDAYHLFRTPEEFIKYISDLSKRMKLSTERRLVIYIHNASYDLSYLLPYIQKYYPGKEERHCIMHGEHKIIQYYQGGLEFRCSYLLSGVSLERWSKEMNVEHQKQVGLYDYDAIIYQDSELDLQSLTYDEYDVLSMQECFDKQLEAHGDYIASIPLTSTGYSRRLLRNNCESDPYFRKEYFKDNQLDIDSMLFCLESYAGGYTHNNRYKKSTVQIAYSYNDEKLNGKIKHKDFRSHYPTQLRKYPMPWGMPELYYDIRDHESYFALHNHDIGIDELINMYPDYFCIAAIRIDGMILKDMKISMPFMQKSKMKDMDVQRCLCDNGRLITCIGSFTTYVDNLTLKIIRDQYKFDYKIMQVYRFKTKSCPKPIADTIDKLFKDKSDYKILWKKYQKEYGEFHEKTVEAAFNLLQSKKLLNSIYGCLATMPLRNEYDLDFEHYNQDTGELDPFIVVKDLCTRGLKEEALNEFYNKRSSFLHYPVGVACTALARYELYEYITTIGYDRVLYVDTDSIFYLTTSEIEEKVAALNAEKRKTAPYITNIKGEKIYYDVFEDEPDIIAFKGLHSKCYGYITESNELKLVVAGVPERTLIGLGEDGKPIYLTREEEIKGITKELKLSKKYRENKSQKKLFKKIRRNIDFLNRLYDNKEFHVNTGVTARYITSEPHIEIVNGHKISTAGGCIINKLETKLVHDMEFTDDVTIQYYDYYGE